MRTSGGMRASIVLTGIVTHPKTLNEVVCLVYLPASSIEALVQFPEDGGYAPLTRVYSETPDNADFSSLSPIVTCKETVAEILEKLEAVKESGEERPRYGVTRRRRSGSHRRPHGITCECRECVPKPVNPFEYNWEQENASEPVTAETVDGSKPPVPAPHFTAYAPAGGRLTGGPNMHVPVGSVVPPHISMPGFPGMYPIAGHPDLKEAAMPPFGSNADVARALDYCETDEVAEALTKEEHALLTYENEFPREAPYVEHDVCASPEGWHSWNVSTEWQGWKCRHCRILRKQNPWDNSAYREAEEERLRLRE